MSDVIEFPPAQKRPDLLIGPFQYWAVQVDGLKVPGLTGYKGPTEGEIHLVVDGRFSGGPFDEATAYQAAILIAQAAAVASGYSHMGAENKDRPFAPKLMGIGSVDE